MKKSFITSGPELSLYFCRFFKIPTKAYIIIHAKIKNSKQAAQMDKLTWSFLFAHTVRYLFIRCWMDVMQFHVDRVLVILGGWVGIMKCCVQWNSVYGESRTRDRYKISRPELKLLLYIRRPIK